MKNLRILRPIALTTLVLWTLGTSPAMAQPSRWLQKWNQQADPSFQIKPENLLLKESTSDLFPGLWVAGIKQSDGSYTLSKIIWKDKDYTPLAGLGAVLSDLSYADLDDQHRKDLFLKLLQETYGSIGLKPYTGKSCRADNRPEPILGMRAPDDSQRFQVWLYKVPIRNEEGEWREVLFILSPDGSQISSKTLNSFYPEAERLRDFPKPSSELFE